MSVGVGVCARAFFERGLSTKREGIGKEEIVRRTISDCGIFVLQNTTAPNPFRISTRLQSLDKKSVNHLPRHPSPTKKKKPTHLSAGLPIKLTHPSVLSNPFTSNPSFTLTGNPCNGPFTRPSLAKNSSNPLASSIASRKKISVQQRINCCAMAARWQKALTTSTAERAPVAIRLSRVRADVVSVMERSWAESKGLVRR